MPLRTVRSPKALLYVVCSVSSCSFAYTLVVLVVLRRCFRGPRERCGSQGSCSVVASGFLTCEQGVFSEKGCGR